MLWLTRHYAGNPLRGERSAGEARQALWDWVSWNWVLALWCEYGRLRPRRARLGEPSRVRRTRRTSGTRLPELRQRIARYSARGAVQGGR